MTWRSFIERARRSMRVTTSVSPRTDEVEDDPEFGPVLEGAAAAGLGPDHGAARGLERRDLDIRVLVRGRDPGIAYPGR